MKAFKLIRTASATAALLAFGSGAFAQSTVSVNVKVTLTSKCQWSGTAPTGVVIDFGPYTAFQTGAATPATPPVLTVECTRNATTPTAAWDTPVAANGTVAGLLYTLTTPTGSTTPGAAATASAGAGADTVKFTLDGSIAGGQAGDTGASASVTRTLTMSF